MIQTISDIARIAGVSKATVSRVINNSEKGVGKETRERILAIIKENNYRPNALARSVATSKSMTIGIVIPDISNPFFPKLVRGVTDYVSSLGYTALLCNSDSNAELEKQYVRMFEEKRVDGLILVIDNKEIPKYVSIPCVYLDRAATGSKRASVCINNFNGGLIVGEYLIKSGAQNIVFIGGEKKLTNSAQRLAGFREALSAHSYELGDEAVIFGDFSINTGYECTKKLIAENIKFDAIFAACDLIAIGALNALKEAKISVPSEVQLVGFDDIMIAELMGITTIVQPVYEMATEAARMLIDIIEEKTQTTKHITIEPSLVVRDTTRRRKKQVIS